MRPLYPKSLSRAAICLLLWASHVASVVAQDIEPRRWSQFPTGSRFSGIGYMYTSGDVEFDPVLRIDEAKADTHTVALSYIQYFSLFAQTARFDLQLPLHNSEWDGLVDGAPTSVGRNGPGDPHARLSFNFAGAPALNGKEFLAWRAAHPVGTSAGIALDVQLPLGRYDEDKLINLGQNRYVFLPQLGVLHTRGPWSFELTGSAYYFGKNDEFYGDNTLEQDPLYALQTHAVRSFSTGWWFSTGVAYGWGGRSQISGVRKDDSKRNLLYGASFGMPLGRKLSARFGYIRGRPLEDVGTDSHNLFVTWTLRW